MANLIREALNADGMPLVLFTGGMSKAGFNLAGTWTGTVKFYSAGDAVNFQPLSVTPFASGATVQSATANGSWEALVQNALATKVVFSRTTGTVVVTMSTSIDSSYQDAFLAATSKYVVATHAAGAACVITQAAQANRAWRLRTLVTGFSVAPAADSLLTISDGASSTIWQCYVPKGQATYNVPLPADPNTPGLTGGGVVGTPGNSMVITLADGAGSVTSSLSAEFVAA
jgi:hypothetical protein